MSVNSSSSPTAFLLPPLLFPSNASALFFNCFNTPASNLVFTAYTFTGILVILPLAAFVLLLGHQRRRSTSHADFITYHMVAMDMIYVFGSVLHCAGFYTRQSWVMMVGSHVFFIASCGQISFHILTCMERYMAAVHSVAYRRLRHGGGVAVRNGIVWSAWLAAGVQMFFMFLKTTSIIFMVSFGQQVAAFVIVSFCSVSVLRVLKRPRPGEGSRDGDRVDPVKQRASNTIVAVMGTLLLRIGANILFTTLYVLVQMSADTRCLLIESSYWFCLPSSLVLPLLFLHRAGKLPCWNNEA